MLLRGFDFGFGSGGRAEDGGFSDGREGLGNVAAISEHSRKGRATKIALYPGRGTFTGLVLFVRSGFERLPEPAAPKSRYFLGLMASQLFENASACILYQAPKK